MGEPGRKPRKRKVKPRVVITVGDGTYRRRVRPLNKADRIRAAQNGLVARADRKAVREQVEAQIVAEKEVAASRRAKLNERPISKEAQRAMQVLSGIVPKRRESNGRAQRPTRKEMERLEQLRREGEKVIVLKQPHRKGDARQECSSAFGRFLLRQSAEHRVALKHAGDQYAAAVHGWRAAKGVPSNGRGGEIGTGEGASEATVARWYRIMIESDKVMSQASHNGWLYVRQLALDEYDIGMDQDGECLIALEALAVHSGMMRETRHPFRS